VESVQTHLLELRLGADHYPVWLSLLGSFRLLRHGRPVPVRSGGKTEALLVSLGMATRQGVPRETLLQRLWPDADAQLASNALNNLVHNLRGVLGDALDGAPPIIHAGGYYRLNQDAGIGVDVVEFKALAIRTEHHARRGEAAATAEVATRAVGLYRGDLNVGSGHEARDIFERAHLRAICLALLMRLADDALARADFEACDAYAMRLLAYDPCREDAHRLVMRCHVRRGERAQALRHFQTVQDILHAEFDVEPELATRALYEQIRLDPSGV
jgi:DNA-binding SARP family transcriptional activator